MRDRKYGVKIIKCRGGKILINRPFFSCVPRLVRDCSDRVYMSELPHHTNRAQVIALERSLGKELREAAAARWNALSAQKVI
jgi:hypothetical protein